ncbi:MAG TPA: hypothetical protein VEF34_19920, partial [Syntrophobacteraceae bacterium]|nr:hypothetical protein [Syntrophobacteraceae bacterium]
MKPKRWREIERLHNSALELEPRRRKAFLAEAFAGDESIRKDVELAHSPMVPGSQANHHCISRRLIMQRI